MFCPRCAAENPDEAQYCGDCGNPLPRPESVEATPTPGTPPSPTPTPANPPVSPPITTPASSKKIAAGVLGILLGSLGIHKFYLGYHVPGVILLIAGTIGWFLIFPGMAAVAVGIIEGIIYLTKTDEEFNRIYVENQRPWF